MLVKLENIVLRLQRKLELGEDDWRSQSNLQDANPMFCVSYFVVNVKAPTSMKLMWNCSNRLTVSCAVPSTNSKSLVLVDSYAVLNNSRSTKLMSAPNLWTSTSKPSFLPHRVLPDEGIRILPICQVVYLHRPHSIQRNINHGIRISHACWISADPRGRRRVGAKVMALWRSSPLTLSLLRLFIVSRVSPLTSSRSCFKKTYSLHKQH